MKNLGKIILFFALSLPLLAEVKVSVDNDKVTRGENVTLTLSITGEGEVKIVPFDRLCGVDVQGRMQSRKEIFSNGKRAIELSLMYAFMPEKSCVIEPLSVSVGGKEHKTEPINITVSKMSISKNEPFIVKLDTDKKSVYVGEPFEMKVGFQQLKNMDVLAESISLTDSKNIWIKSEHKGKGYLQDGYARRDNIYAISAQQSGKLNLGPLRWDLQIRSHAKDYWGTWMTSAKRRAVFSNELEIDVKPLPEGVDLVGDINIEATVDKSEINAGEAVNVTITVKGRANVEDIHAFDLHLQGAQAFKEEPTLKHMLEDGKYVGLFTQKLALVAQRDFTIPSFELRYMDVETDSVITIQSEPIKIKVLNPIPLVKEELKISRPEIEAVKEEKSFESSALTLVQGIFLFLGGVVLGLILSLIPWHKIRHKEKSKQSISAKESKEVLQLLMGNMQDNGEIEELVQKLSENLYEGKSHAIDKKRLKAIVKRLQA